MTIQSSWRATEEILQGALSLYPSPIKRKTANLNGLFDCCFVRNMAISSLVILRSQGGIKTTIQEGIPEGSDEESEQSQKDISFLVVNLIAYIASSNADIEKSPTPSTPSWRRTGGKAQKGAPVTDWNVGYRIGPAIEKAFSKTYTGSSSADGNHASSRPHIRAAHWHHYWTGPKEERQLSLRWVSQAFVNCTDAENLPVVERRDKKTD